MFGVRAPVAVMTVEGGGVAFVPVTVDERGVLERETGRPVDLVALLVLLEDREPVAA